MTVPIIELSLIKNHAIVLRIINNTLAFGHSAYRFSLIDAAGMMIIVGPEAPLCSWSILTVISIIKPRFEKNLCFIGVYPKFLCAAAENLPLSLRNRSSLRNEINHFFDVRMHVTSYLLKIRECFRPSPRRGLTDRMPFSPLRFNDCCLLRSQLVQADRMR